MKPMKPMEPMKPMSGASNEHWWPKSLGDSPNSAGGQNDVCYAYFGAKHRLAVDTGDGQVRVYDVGDHQITGVQQAQSGGGKNVVFSGDKGDIKLADLKEVDTES